MGPGEIVEWAKAAAVGGGVFGGLFAVFSVAWVWLKHHIFRNGRGVTLCLCGTFLVLAPLYKQVSFVSGFPHIEFKLSELERELARTRVALDESNKKYAEVAASWQRISAAPLQVTKLQQDIDQLVTKVNQASAQVNEVNAASHSALEYWRAFGIDGKSRSNAPDNLYRPQTAPFDPFQDGNTQPQFTPGDNSKSKDTWPPR